MGTYTCALVITGRCISRTAQMICLALFRAALLRVVQWGGFYSWKYLLWLAWLELIPGVFRFKRCVFQHHRYSISLDSQPYTFLTYWRPVCTSCVFCFSGFPYILLSLTFLEGYPKLSEELDGNLCTTWYGGFNPNLQEVSAILIAWLLFSLCSCCRYLRIVIVPWFPYERGSKVFEGAALRLQAINREVFYLPSGIVTPWQRRHHRVLLPSLWSYYFCCRLLYYSIEEERLRK